jgi:MFS superfamily sulfate permease-like transporter
MAAYATPEDPYAGHGFLVLCSIVAGVVLMVMGLTGMGKLVRLVPHSIVVGFTIGIAVTIASSQVGEVLGYHTDIKGNFFKKVETLWAHRGEFDGFAVLLAMVTFLVTRELLRVSIYIPAPLIAIGVGTLLAATADGTSVTLISTKYGRIPTDFFVLTPPAWPDWVPFATVVRDLLYFAAAIIFVSGVESLLCSRMADRLADNRGTPFNPDKEFWGQGWVQVIVPWLNGFPHTGALARTATNIKLGAVTPLAGICKCFLKLLLAFYLATFLERVPMACLGGILLWVAVNMVKPAEVKQVLAHNWFHVGLMVLTAVLVILTDFLTGVLAAMITYAALFKFLDRPAPGDGEEVEAQAGSGVISHDGHLSAGPHVPAGQTLSEAR